jgi:hypothetical protein
MNADDADLFSMVTMEVDGHTRNANFIPREGAHASFSPRAKFFA